MSNSSDSAARSCCLCGPVASQRPFRKVGEHALVRCRDCSLVFLRNKGSDPSVFLNDAAIGGETEYWGFPRLYEKHSATFDGFFAERLERLKKHQPRLQNLFDAGTGFGLWLDYCARNGLRCGGIELSRDAATFSRETLNLEVRHADLETDGGLKAIGFFDAVTVCDVLEHLTNPVAALGRLRGILNSGGLLYVQVPNELKTLRYPPQRKWGVPHHLWHFEEKTLRRLLERSGFQFVESWTGIQGVIGVYERGGPSWLQRVAWKMARVSKTGNRLQILARKTGP